MYRILSYVLVEIVKLTPCFFADRPIRARDHSTLPSRVGRRSRGGGARPDPRGTPARLCRPQGRHERLQRGNTAVYRWYIACAILYIFYSSRRQLLLI